MFIDASYVVKGAEAVEEPIQNTTSKRHPLLSSNASLWDSFAVRRKVQPQFSGEKVWSHVAFAEACVGKISPEAFILNALADVAADAGAALSQPDLATQGEIDKWHATATLVCKRIGVIEAACWESSGENRVAPPQPLVLTAPALSNLAEE